MIGGKGGATSPPPPINPGALGLPVLDIRKEHAVETYKSLTTTGLEAIKTALLLNGGAAIAFITLLGNLLTKAGVSGMQLPNLKPALAFYLLGLTAAGAALVLGYFVTLRVYQESRDQLAEVHPKILAGAIGATLVSYGCFVAGSVIATLALSAII